MEEPLTDYLRRARYLPHLYKISKLCVSLNCVRNRSNREVHLAIKNMMGLTGE